MLSILRIRQSIGTALLSATAAAAATLAAATLAASTLALATAVAVPASSQETSSQETSSQKPPTSTRGEWTGYFGIEFRAFESDLESDLESDAAQANTVGSLVLEPEYFRQWNDGRDRFVVRPFLRFDADDDERSHFDFREFYWQRLGNGWQLDVGLRKVFWGVTESVHLVDIVNQTDLVEDPDGEDKLGQPMVHVGWSKSWGRLDLYLLTGFRERTFPGLDGRLRPSLEVDTDAAAYASGADQAHLDLALRWSRVLGDVDFGVSYFRGTSREPLLLPETRAEGLVLIPFYSQIDQLGLDLQATLDAWLWKLEAISRWSPDPEDRNPGFGDYLAAAGGFEYTFFDLRGSGLDVGLLLEYLWDERGNQATTAFEDDFFVGARLAWNDVQSTELLVGAAWDVDSNAAFINLEGSRRLGERYELEARLRAFVDPEPEDPLVAFENDDYLQLTLKRYF